MLIVPDLSLSIALNKASIVAEMDSDVSDGVLVALTFFVFKNNDLYSDRPSESYFKKLNFIKCKSILYLKIVTRSTSLKASISPSSS